MSWLQHAGPAGTDRTPAHPGDPVDPPPKHLAPTLAKVDRKGVLAGSAFGPSCATSHTNTSCWRPGTTYYAFLSLFAILVFVFGLTALIGSERLAQTAARQP